MDHTAVIIGCGTIASKHASAVVNSGNTLVAVCDIDSDKAKAFAEQFNARAYTDYEDMLTTEKPDAVHICLPHYLHCDAALLSLKLGCKVFLEKPPAMTRAQLEMLESADDGKNITVCFQNRFNATTECVKQMIASQRFGRLLGAMAITSWCRRPEYYLESGWRGKLDTEGGSCLINQSVHALDMLTFLLGTPTAFASSMANLTHPETETEDTVTAVIDFGDKRATFFATNCKSPAAEYTLYFENATVIFDCNRVTVRQNGIDTVIMSKAEPGTAKAYWGDSHGKLISEFYASFENGKNPCPLSECKSTMSLMFDMYKDHRGE